MFFFHQSLELEPCEIYMLHPVNIFHILTRMSMYVSKLVKLPKSFEKALKDSIMIEYEAAQGLINVQDYHDIDVMDIANGNVKGFHSASNMTANELYFIANIGLKNVDKNGKLQQNLTWALYFDF